MDPASPPTLVAAIEAKSLPGTLAAIAHLRQDPASFRDLSFVEKLPEWVFEGGPHVTPEGTTNLQEATLSPLIEALDPNWVQGADALFRMFCDFDHEALIENMLNRNFQISSCPQNQSALAVSLANGKWPYPEKVMPQVLDLPNARRSLLFRLSVAIGEGRPVFFTTSHAQRMLTLRCEYPNRFKRDFHELMPMSFGSESAYHAQAPHAFALYDCAGLLSIDELLENNMAPATRQLLHQARATRDVIFLDQTTPSGQPLAPPRRL